MTDPAPQKLFTAPIPTNEAERLAALHRYKILDTPPEAAFDRITKLAARLFDIPIALISLVDESRAWFKSCVGFGAQEVPRDNTLCSFAVLTDEPLIVPDTRLDDRFACNPFVQAEPGVRFYAGAPLLSHDGFNLGTLCLLDGQPRDLLTTEQQATLVDLAAMVVDELELRLAAHRIAQIDAALRFITQSVATVTGGAFLDALVQHFATVLDVNYAYVGLVEGDHPRMLRTIATCAHGQIVDNLEYPLQDTPCWEVIEQRKICCYPRNVQAHFPNAPLLKPLSIESYVAIPFFDSSGTALGLLGVMDSKPLDPVYLAEALLTVFAGRIATELERQQTEAALQKSEEQSRNILESINDGFFALDENWRFTYVNQAAEELTHRTAAELLGKNFWEAFPGVVGTEFEQLHHRAMSDRVAGSLIAFYPDHDRWYAVHSYPGVQGITVYFRNVTAQIKSEEALRQSEERFQAFMNHSPAAYWITDRDGRVLYLNQTYFHLFRFVTQNVIGKTVHDIYPTDVAQQFLDNIQQAADTHQVVETTEIAPRFDGTMGEFLVYKFPISHESENVLVGGVAIDITDRKQAEINLRDSETKLRLFIEQAPANVAMLDHEMRYLLVSQRWVDTYHLESIAAVVGRSHYDLFPNLPEYWIKIHQQCLTGESAKCEEDLFLLPDGSEQWLSWEIVPWYTSTGTVGGILIFFEDITSRKQAEIELRQKNAILDVVNESAPTPIFVKDRQGRIIYANPATLEVLGKSAAEVIGYRDCDLYSNPEDAARVMENDRRIMESGQMEVVEESPDGIRTFLGMKVPYRNEAGEVIGLIGISNDITDRVQVERDRERILQQEQAARETAENANRIKDEFLAVLSHELRSPLNPILGWTRLLQNGKLDAARQREALNTIERNAKLQTQLIEDLLDISRIMQGKLSLTVTPVSLTFVITAAVETVRLAAEAKNIQILLDLPATIAPVSGDAARLQQVVWNLLTNAVKFTPSGGQVTIELQQLDYFAQIRVMDTGKGIDPQFLPHVFEYFRQADATTTRKFGGLGLGLAIVRQIVEMHGGTVKVESEGENRGATFTVQLPLSAQAPSGEAEPPCGRVTTEAPLKNLQILLVDDETDTREFQAFVLEQGGARVTAVASGFEALQALEQFIPDVLVSDIGMAEMNGYMLIQQIRSREALRSNSRPYDRHSMIPAIALTAYAAEIDQQKALQAGFQTHITKPVEPEELVRAIACLCERNQGNVG
jgi:PAS domain S-box-containing protein